MFVSRALRERRERSLALMAIDGGRAVTLASALASLASDAF